MCLKMHTQRSGRTGQALHYLDKRVSHQIQKLISTRQLSAVKQRYSMFNDKETQVKASCTRSVFWGNHLSQNELSSKSKHPTVGKWASFYLYCFMYLLWCQQCLAVTKDTMTLQRQQKQKTCLQEQKVSLEKHKTDPTH